MNKNLDHNMHIGVLVGGSKTEKKWSYKSGKNIVKNLKLQGFRNVKLLNTDKQSLDILPKCEIIFIATLGKPWQSGKAQSLCKFYGVSYTGSSEKTSALAFNKHLAKLIFKKNNISTPEWLYSSHDYIDWKTVKSKIGNEIILKPVDDGLSNNIFKVNDDIKYCKAFKIILKDNGRVMIEKFIHGIEITVPIIRAQDTIVLPPIEILKESDIVDYVIMAKSKSKKNMYRKFNVEKKYLNHIKDVAEKCFLKLGCVGVGYVDMIFNNKNFIPYVLEVGTIPGFTDKSKVPFAASLANIPLSKLLEISLLIALNKNFKIKEIL